MCSRSRRARSISLTRYAMLGAEFFEGLSRGFVSAALQVLHALANAFAGIGAGSDVEEPLVGVGILHDRLGLAVHSYDHRAFALLELLHELAGPPAEGGERLNVLLQIERPHGFSNIAP